MKEAVKTNASRFGLMAAAIGVGFTLIAYLLNLELMVNFYVGIILFVVALVIYIMSVLQTRRQMGGFISFRDAFSSFILAYMISALLTTAFNILLFAAVDTEAAEQLNEMTIDTMVETLEKVGTPGAQIEEAIERMEESNQFAVGQQVKGFFWGVLVYAIIGLIVAAIMKREAPVVIEDTESND